MKLAVVHFNKLNNYVKTIIACHPLLLNLLSIYPKTDNVKYIHTKGLIIKIKTILNGRTTNKYLILEILNRMVVDYTDYQLFSMIS